MGILSFLFGNKEKQIANLITIKSNFLNDTDDGIIQLGFYDELERRYLGVRMSAVLICLINISIITL